VPVDDVRVVAAAVNVQAPITFYRARLAPRPKPANRALKPQRQQDGSGVLLGDGEQHASPLDDLAAVPAGNPVHPLVKVRGAVEGHRPGELRAPAMLAPKGPPPPGRHPDHRIGLVGDPKVPAWQLPGEVPRLVQGIQPAGAVTLRCGKAGVPGAPPSEGPAPGSAARFGDPQRPDIAGVPP
jgi:hypothetical protein